MAVRVRDDESPARGQLRPELPHRQVERRRGLEQGRVGLVEAVLRAQPVQLVDDGTVRDRNALGSAGGAGREDDVGRVVGGEHTAALGGLHRRGRGAREIELCQIDDRCCGGDLRADGTGCQYAQRSCGLQHERVALGRLIRIDRDVGTAGHGDGVHTDEQIHRSPNGKPHRHFGSHAQADQVAGQARYPIGELAVRQRAVVVHECNGVTVARGRVHEQIGERGAACGIEVTVGVVPLVDDGG